MNDKKFIYVPSFSAGSYGNSIAKNLRFKNGKPIRLYDNEMDSTLKHDWFLAPAGHLYKKMNYRDLIGIPKGSPVKLLGDSGGFQIATGAIEWSPDLKDKILKWLEENSDFAVNLDIPPKIKYAGKFKHCLEISKENFKYFYENQSGKTKFLNVMQGEDVADYQYWYDNVKGFEFNGWCLGGCGGSLNRFIGALATFLDNEEHLNKNNEIVHILGTSKVIDFFILSQFQYSLNQIGCDIQVTTDSSSPNNSSRFGTYYTHVDYKEGSFKQIHVPKTSLGQQYDMILGLSNLPKTATCDNWLEDCYTWDDLDNFTAEMYAIIVLHNYGIFRDAKNFIDNLVSGHPYMMEQIASKDIVQICAIVNEMVTESLNGTKAISIYNKNKNLISSVSHRYEKQNLTVSKNNDYF